MMQVPDGNLKPRVEPALTREKIGEYFLEWTIEKRLFTNAEYGCRASASTLLVSWVQPITPRSLPQEETSFFFPLRPA